MFSSKLTLISPSVAHTDKSEAELFGAMVWLWMHSKTHRQCPLFELERLLLPAIKTGQFVLALDNTELQRPVGLMTWAWFTAEMEQRYLKSLDRTLRPYDWQQGDRPWVLDWISPFGHSYGLVRSILKELLNQSCFRTLYHKGDQTGLRVMYFRGNDITPEQESSFWSTRRLVD